MTSFKKYNLSDFAEQKKDDREYWSSVTLKDKMDAMYKLWVNYCKLKGLNPDEQRLRRIFKITKLSQS